MKVGCFVGLIASCWVAQGQWITQTVTLRPGWNSVFLEVQPEPKQCDTVLDGLPIESVWAWNSQASPVQFIQDPEELIAARAGWLTYFPPDHPARETRNLFTLDGGHSYLIKLAPTAGPVTWSLLGRPIIRGPGWVPNSFNLTGFWLASEGAPTFEQFFADAPAHRGQPMFRLMSNGRWEKVVNPAATLMRRSEAYWIYSQGASQFAGPLSAEIQQSSGLNYGRQLMELPLVIRNHSGSPRSITLRPLDSAIAPAGSPAVAGSVPLALYRPDDDFTSAAWVNLETAWENPALAAGQDWFLRVGVRRIDMAESEAREYQSLLEVQDDAGSRLVIPVTSLGLSTAGSGGGLPASAHAGLWVGHATITHVNEAGSDGDFLTPTPTGIEFPFRILVHIDSSGTPRLLQKAVQLANPANGQGVLLTDDAIIAQWLAVPNVAARKVSAPAFSFRNPLVMMTSSVIPEDGSSATVDVVLGYDDPRNPFKHRYHPEHDNLDIRFESVLPKDVESYEVTRTVSLEFADDFAGPPLAGRGDDQLGGTYRETLTGLHRRALHVSGTFWLRRVSPVSELNQPPL